MKYKLPILTLVVAGLLWAAFRYEPRTRVMLAVLTGTPVKPIHDPDLRRPLIPVAPPEDKSTSSPSATNEPPPRLPGAQLGSPSLANAGAPPQDPAELIHEAARNVFRAPSIEAKFRQRIDMFGHQLTGAGTYRQLGSADVKLLRLELKLQVGEQVTNLLQVCDGRFLWVRRDTPPTTSLNRIDLRDVGRAIESQPDETATDWSRHWMMLGGLAKLLGGLGEQFEFHSAMAVTHVASPGETAPAWELRGRLKRERLAALLPGQGAKIEAGETPRTELLPSQWPDRVVVLLTRDDARSLLPLRIDFQRSPPVGKSNPPPDDADLAARAKTLMTLEFFDTQIGKLRDDSLFTYIPGNQEVFDDTERFLRSLKLK